MMIVTLFATAEEEDSADNKAKSDDDDAGEEEAADTVSVINGQKVELIDGHMETWATTFVIDAEPAFPKDWHRDAKVGEYILVRGGIPLPAKVRGSKPMVVASRWNDVELFKKPGHRKRIKKYINYPGVLQFNWKFFQDDITPADLMRTEEFLVDLQHIKALKPTKTKGKKEKTAITIE
jgi:hypothetical protein